MVRKRFLAERTNDMTDIINIIKIGIKDPD